MRKKAIKKKLPSARTVVITSLIVDISDILLSLGVAIMSGSVIMATEVLEGIADLVASGALVLGVQRAKSRANKYFPFGYGREVYFWTFLSAVIIIGITSTFSIYFGLQRFFNPRTIHNLPATYAVLILTTLTNAYAFRLSYKRLRSKTHIGSILYAFLRSSLIETKTTFVLDFVGTSASLVGLVALILYQLTGDKRLDGIGAIGIGIILIIFGFLLILGIRDLLIGKSASDETLKRIKKVSLSLPEIKKVLDLKTMHIGSDRLLVNMEVSMDQDMKTEEIAKIIDKVKEKIRDEIPTVKHIQVELELP